jgi:hypothetical protein
MPARPRRAVLSVITHDELVYGVERSRFREQAASQLSDLVGLLPVMEIPLEAGRFHGAMRGVRRPRAR